MEDVNFEGTKGEIISLMGPSGAGKTVLLRMVAGLDTPDTGKVYFKLDGELGGYAAAKNPEDDGQTKDGFHASGVFTGTSRHPQRPNSL